MEWLWLILSIVGLGLLWLLIMGMEKLTERLKANDEARKIHKQDIAERTAEAEAEFIERQYAKASAMEYIETADLSDRNNSEQMSMLQEAIDTLNTDELIQSVARRVFGPNQGTDGIKAEQSAFDVQPKKVTAKGDGITPVKVKPASKSTLSKSEQKMLKKIKQGY